MVSVILLWIYMFLTIYPIGFFTLDILYKKPGNNKERGIDGYMVLLAGMVVNTVYAETYSLFDGVGGKASILLIAVNVLIVIKYRDEFRKRLGDTYRRLNSYTFGRSFLILLSVFLCIYFTSSGLFVSDTGLYHAQAIRWIEDYGVVKGLVNVQYRLAYNSSAMCFFALYSLRWLLGQSYHACNGFVLLIVYLYGLNNIYNRKDKGDLNFFVSLGSLICGWYLMLNILSPSSDGMPTLLVLLITMKWSELINKEEKDIISWALLSVASITAFTGKVSTAMIVLIVIYPAIRLIMEKHIKEIFIYVFLGLICIAPFVARNVIISGWLLYPLSLIDMFDLPYKYPKDLLEVDAWRSMIGSRFCNCNWYEFEKWMPLWWKNIGYVGRVWFVMDLLAAVLFITAGIKDLSIKKVDLLGLHITAVFAAGLIYWFVTGPVVRYSSSFIILFPMVVIGVLYTHLRRFDTDKSTKGTVFKVLVTTYVSLMISGLIPTEEYLSSVESYRLNHICVLKQQDYEVPDMLSYDMGGVEIFYPKEGDLSWYNAFPASPDKETATNVEMLGSSINDGFKMKKHYSIDKTQLIPQ